MIKKEDLSAIEKALGIKEGELKTIIEDKDEKPLPVAIDTFEIVPKTEYDTRITNMKKEAGTAAVEIAVKEARTKLNLDFQGKTVENLIAAANKKALEDAKIEPDKKVKELSTDLEKMKNNYETEKQRADRIEGEYKQKEKLRTINTNIVGALPKQTIIPLDEVAELALRKAAANGIVPDISDTGAVIFKKGDDILKDKNLVPLKADEVLKDFYTPYIKPATGGDGGGDGTGQAKPGSFDAFCIEMNEKGIREGTKAFNDEMKDRITKKTLVL
jgi:hypothetical protein